MRRHSRLKGLAAIVVGAGSVASERETARIIAANEGMVMVADIRKQAARDVASAIVADGGKAIAVPLDVGNQARFTLPLHEPSGSSVNSISVNAAAIMKAGPLERRS